jgi:hypothetical protein
VTKSATIGLDIAKQVFQVHGADKSGRPVPSPAPESRLRAEGAGKLFKRRSQIETGDAPARANRQTRFRRRRQHNAWYVEALDAFGGEQAGDAFGTGLQVKHQSGWNRLRDLRVKSAKMGRDKPDRIAAPRGLEGERQAGLPALRPGGP